MTGYCILFYVLYYPTFIRIALVVGNYRTAALFVTAIVERKDRNGDLPPRIQLSVIL